MGGARNTRVIVADGLFQNIGEVIVIQVQVFFGHPAEVVFDDFLIL